MAKKKNTKERYNEETGKIEEITKDWSLYEAGLTYNEELFGEDKSYNDNIDANRAFFSGDQWRNVKAKNLPKPVFNIIKRVVTFFVASLTSQDIAVNFKTLEYSEEETKKMELGMTPEEIGNPDIKASQLANSEVKNILEKSDFSSLVREGLFDAAITGDMCMHMYFDKDKIPYNGRFKNIKGEIEMELVDGSNVMFGNANNPTVEKQPYIIIVGRDLAKNLQEEANANSKSKDKKEVKADDEYEYQQGDNGKVEVEADGYGKALYLIIYKRDCETGKIRVSKCTKECYMYEDVDTDLVNYPIAFMNWEKQKNEYHGRAVVSGMLPNQIAINKMFAMVIYHLMLTAFPPTVYDAKRISGISNEVGAIIPIDKLQPNESFSNLIGQLPPGNMSGNIMQVIDLAFQYTKETMGINDASLGNVRPENTSAIIAVQKSTVVPLENVKGNLFQFIKDIGRILMDMMGTYYGKRPIAVTIGNDRKVMDYDFKEFKNLWLDIKANVGNASYWSEIASQATLDNLLMQEKIDMVQYLERVPDSVIPMRNELIAQIKGSTPDGGVEFEELYQFMQQLPPEIQAKLQSMPDAEQEQELKRMFEMAKAGQINVGQGQQPIR